MSPGSSHSVAYIDSRSARSSTRASAPSSSASVSAFARSSSSSARHLRRELLQLLEIGRLDGRDVDARPDRRPADAHRRAADEREREHRDVLGEALVAHEPAVEPAALATGEQLRGEVERVEARVAEHRRAEPDVHPRQRHAVLDGLPDLGADDRRQRHVGQRRDVRVGRDRAEVLLGERAHGRPVAVARDAQDRVVGGVVGGEERLDVVQRGGVEVLHRADRRVVVRVLLGEQVAEDLLVPRPVRPVVVAPALLVLHDLALVVEVLLAERLEQRPHPVRLEPDRELQLVRRQRLEVVRAVEPRRAVERPAGALDEGHVLRLADVRAALEHHVLEQVREAGLARDLVLGADVVPEVHGDHGREVVLGDDQAQPVRQALIAELDDGNGHAQRTSGTDGGSTPIVGRVARTAGQGRGDSPCRTLRGRAASPGRAGPRLRCQRVTSTAGGHGSQEARFMAAAFARSEGPRG